MKIALVNYRYFFSGGPERYLFNIKEILESHGHTVVPFSVKHNKNTPTPYDKYFLEPIGTGNEVYAGEYKKNIRNTFKVLSRMLYSFEAKRKFKYFLEQEKPDIIYILYFQSKISCSIMDAAHEMKIPVIQRISDFSLICPCGSLYRTDSQEICEACLGSNKWKAVRYKCNYHSSVYSLIKLLSIKIQDYIGLKDKIAAFVFPSTFTLEKFIEAGFPQEKLHHIPTLFNKATLNGEIPIRYGDYALYVGRIVPEKGILTMIKAFVNTDYKLKIIGFSDTDYQRELEEFLKGKHHRIEFLGRMDFDRIQEYLSECLFTLIPSEWYDNLPNTILESYAFRKCIVATDLGSLSENIEPGKTGLLFPYKDCDALRECVTYLFDHPQDAEKMGEQAYKLIETKYDMDSHYRKLIRLMESTFKH